MTLTPPPWSRYAACAGTSPDLWFPTRGAPPKDVKRAKAICKTCPVRAACLEYALAEDIKFGLWGGCSERERRRMRSARAVALTLNQRSTVA